MKATLSFATLIAGASAYSPFIIPSMTTHQPNGDTSGDVDYYRIAFTVHSTNGDSAQSGYCNTFWGDNCNECNTKYSYSTAVPTGRWIQCDSSAANLGDKNSEFAFQLYPYFGIGNFSVAVQQNFTQTIASVSSQEITSGQSQITNTTSQYTCTVDRSEDSSVQVHASGDCSMPSNAPAFSIAVTSDAKACTHATTVDISFSVTWTTQPGESILVVGNTTELGGWDTSKAVALNAAQYTASYNLWTGMVPLPAGEAFEYKFLLKHIDGSLTWECCENRISTVSSYTCGSAPAGNGPDTFRD